MWKDLFKLAKQLINLAQDTDRNKTRIQEVQEQVEDLTAQMRWVVFELRRQAEHDAHEREKLALRLENELLRFERRLPGGKSKGK
jgi:hypothetical protein